MYSLENKLVDYFNFPDNIMPIAITLIIGLVLWSIFGGEDD